MTEPIVTRRIPIQVPDQTPESIRDARLARSLERAAARLQPGEYDDEELRLHLADELDPDRKTHAALFPEGCGSRCRACLIRVWLPQARAILDGHSRQLPTIWHLEALDLHYRLVIEGGR